MSSTTLASSGSSVSLASVLTPAVEAAPVLQQPALHHLAAGGEARKARASKAGSGRVSFLLPAAMVPLGMARDDPALRRVAPLVDAARANAHRSKQRRANALLVDVLLRHSEGRALILPASANRGWGAWGLALLRWLGYQPRDPAADDERDWAEPDDEPPAPKVPTLPELPERRPRRYPLVRRTLSSPGPYSAKYPASNEYTLFKTQFAPRAPRRRLNSDASQQTVLEPFERDRHGRHLTEWPVHRPEPRLRLGERVAWDVPQDDAFSPFIGVAGAHLALQYNVWGMGQRLALWRRIFELRAQLVEHYGEWFRYKRGIFSATKNRVSFLYGSVWQEGPLKPPRGVHVHHCVQFRHAPRAILPVGGAISEEPENAEAGPSGSSGEASESQEASPKPRAAASASMPELGVFRDRSDDMPRTMGGQRGYWIHSYMWEKDGDWFSAMTLEELEVWGATCVTEWIEGWDAQSPTLL